jgi:hypothetical protein
LVPWKDWSPLLLRPAVDGFYPLMKSETKDTLQIDVLHGIQGVILGTFCCDIVFYI